MPHRSSPDLAFRSAIKACLQCQTPIRLINARDLERKKFCSKACFTVWQGEQSGPALPTFREARKCTKCGIDYIAKVNKQEFCSRRCQGREMNRKMRAREGDLAGHLKRLLKRSGRKALTLSFLLALHEKQRGRCALSGLTMTWAVDQGHVMTNVSIDRISSYGGYTEENVQLVCHIANVMKTNLPQSEFIELCRRIVEHSLAAR